MIYLNYSKSIGNLVIGGIMSSYFTLEVGKKVPDFALFDQHHQLFSLAEERGRKVLLSFHPLAWTKICAVKCSLWKSIWPGLMS